MRIVVRNRAVGGALAGLAVATALGVLDLGCVGQAVRGKADGVDSIIDNARKNGAYRCAPKPLALAEAHLQRGRDEMELGNLVPAQRHVALADRNARLAFNSSPRERCVQSDDRDGDGCLDKVDACPDKAEDRDGFKDDDCCPDPDNDGDGIADASDKCPNWPEDRDGFEDEDGCPDLDDDGDGVVDLEDKCRLEPEDHDGHEDSDGCPDDDNDNDRIADLQDKCPDQPEDYDGDEDTDGCPDAKKAPPKVYKLVKVTKSKIELRQKVFFATAKTTVLSRSHPLLNEVAQVLRDRPKIKVRIEGHTDSRGSDRYNQRLSQGRADSVRAYLVGRGIGIDRLRAVGYGEAQPVASNNTRSGRAMNRRVEFVITEQ